MYKSIRTWAKSPLHCVLAIAMVVGVATSARAQGDMIDISQASIYSSPADIASWPITTTITKLTMSTSAPDGLSFEFDKKATWPDYTPPGWSGPIVYTVWAVVNVNGHWNAAGFIQMWRDRASTGAPLLTRPGGICGSLNNFACNWAYSSRWGPMSYTVSGYQPQAGELVGFFVSAGNARDTSTVTSVRERSNVIAVKLPANDNGVFTSASSVVMASAAVDVSGDGKADIGVWAPGTGDWSGLSSDSGYSSSYSLNWGLFGDIPVVGDYDHDGLADIAVWRPSNGVWFVKKSSTSFTQYFTVQWGLGSLNDVPVPADYDGDGQTDIAVWRPSSGVWYIRTSSSGYASYVTIQWGIGSLGDVPVAGDFDGDGKADAAIWRPGNGTWYILTSASNYKTYIAVQWGVGSLRDVPVAADFDGDGKMDVAVWRPGNGTWYVRTSSSSYASWFAVQWGAPGDLPIIGDFDGDHHADITVWRPSTGTWFVRTSSTNYTGGFTVVLGSGNDVPIGANTLRR
jgi:hypothetical protein